MQHRSFRNDRNSREEMAMHCNIEEKKKKSRVLSARARARARARRRSPEQPPVSVGAARAPLQLLKIIFENFFARAGVFFCLLRSSAPHLAFCDYVAFRKAPRRVLFWSRPETWGLNSWEHLATGQKAGIWRFVI